MNQKPRLFILFRLHLLLLLVSAISVAQTDNDSLLATLSILKFHNQKQAIKGADFIYRNATKPLEKNKAALILAENYLITGDYNQSVKYLFYAKSFESQHETVSVRIQTDLLSAEIYHAIGLHENAAEALAHAETLIKNGEIKHPKNAEAAILRLQAMVRNSENDNQIAIAKLEKSAVILAALAKSDNNRAELSRVFYEMAVIYFDLNHIKNTQKYLQKSVAVFPEYQNPALNLQAQIDFKQKKYKRSIETLNLLFADAEENNICLKRDLYKNLADNYFAISDVDSYKSSFDRYQVLERSISSGRKTARLLAISQLEQLKKEELISKRNWYYGLILSIFAGVVIVVFIGYQYQQKINKQYESFQKVIKTIDNNQRLEIHEAAAEIVEVEAIPSKLIQIPQKTTQIILEKLAVFEKSEGYLDSQLSLISLARQLDSNTKYLSETINTQKGKNFHAYINELRINYIVGQLKNNKVFSKYKVSYLAEKSGFTSHSTFATVFKSVTGISPTTFIKFLAKEKQQR